MYFGESENGDSVLRPASHILQSLREPLHLFSGGLYDWEPFSEFMDTLQFD